MSKPGSPQNPYGPPTQPGAPHHVQQSQPFGSAALRPVLFGGAIVVGIAILSNLMALIGSATYSFRGDSILSMFWGILLAFVFANGAAGSSLYLAPLARATSAADLLKKLAVAALVGTAALLVFNFIWSVLNGGQYLLQMIVSSGILGSISTGITYSAFFALGVFIARALPPKPGAFGGERQGYVGQPQGSAGQPQGYAQAPEGYPQQAAAQGYPRKPAAPQGYQQMPAVQPNPYRQASVQVQGQQLLQQPFAPQA